MKRITDKYIDEVIDLTRAVIRYDSSKKDAVGNYPFGKECADCLIHFLAVAEELGFETKNYDNYIGEVIWGEGEDFAILAHLDVVPAGSGWTHDPFGAELNSDVSAGGTEGLKIWGRGALDDKAPAVAILYCFKALKDAGFKPNRRFKLILGCNEESGWECIEHYNKVAVMPEEGFTPDADFPVIYAEFGILHVKTFFDITDIPLSELSSGDAINMVPQYTRAVVGGEVFETFGRSAHASKCELGDNSLGKMIAVLGEKSEEMKNIYSRLFEEKLGLSELVDSTGYLRFSPDLAEYRDGKVEISVDIRYPATFKADEVLSHFDAYGIKYEILSHKEPLYNDPESPLIKTLSRVYNEYAGKELEPLAIGGGTYARALKRGVAFGPEMEGFESPIHAPDEFITVEHLRILFEIYYKAISEIGK